MNIVSVKNRSSALLLALLLLLPAASMTACDDNDGETEVPETKVAVPTAVDHVWKTDYITLPDGVSAWELGNYSYDGNELTFEARHVLDEENYIYENVLLSYDFTAGEYTMTTAPTVDTETYGYAYYTVYPTSGTADGEVSGGMISVFQQYMETTDTTLWNMVRFDADGNEVWNVDLTAAFPITEDQSWFYVSDIMLTADGTIYAFADRAITAFSVEDGTKLFDISVDNYIDNSFMTADGTVYISFYEWDETTGDGGYVYRSVDAEKKALGDALPIPETVNMDNADLFIADGYDLYYKNDTGLYGLNFTDTESTLLCNWINSDLIANDLYTLSVLDSERAVFFDNDPVSGDPQLCVMTPVAPEDVKAKYLIEVAYTERGDSMMQRYAVAFNRESEDYRVVLTDYSQYADGDMTPTEVLTNEIMTGDIPDVIVCTGSGSDYELDADLLADKGLFLDLYTYMDKEGETMNRGAFVPCVLQPMETADGTLPLLVQSFSLATLAGKASVLGEKAVWSVDNLLMFTDTLSEGQYLFASYYDTSASTDGTEPAMSLMKALLSYSLSAFVDEKTATCTFNDGRFASLLRFCTEAPILNSSEIDSEAALLRNNTLALTSLDISGFSDYLQVKSYNFENDITLVGYPVSDETAVSGTIVNPERMMGITKDSPVADGAWEFLKRTFGDTDDENYFWRNGFSSAYAALESMFEEESRSYYIFEEYGWSATHFDPEDEIDLSNWEADAEMSGGVCGHFEEEDKQLFLDIFNHATIVANADDTILSMIEEDASAYFSGAKTLEETVDIIQSRVSIYVSETMG
ncbi:MAG: hypothetical protein IJ449_03550 [Clostridia bacterium]|nr:hypothetical protein [Clostridia bacterium]